MKNKKLELTTNSREYKLVLRKVLNNYEGLCPICGLHTGCNFWNTSHKIKNWKKYRKTKWKE